MFGTPFYHGTARKLVIAFGTLFNNITLVRYKTDGVTEVDRMKVPIAYASKEKFLMRLKEDSELSKGTMMTLPRMGFELLGITYDPQRKQQSTIKNMASASSNTTIRTQFAPVPYNYSFALYITTRNIEDGWQIVEQILPYFNPDYTLKVNFVPNMEDARDVPFTLENVDFIVEDEGDLATMRKVQWTLSFTAQAYLYPAIESGKYIRSAVANTYDITTQTSEYPNQVRVNAGGTGTYKVGEYIYQGTNFATSEIRGIVQDWNETGRVITFKSIGDKPFVPGLVVKGYETNASWSANTILNSPIQMQRITINVEPTTANVGDAYTANVNIDEFLSIG